ncbi:MAG: ADP-ribosylglycohydrolase family protein, partial [Bradymonadaceae bacterium]
MDELSPEERSGLCVEGVALGDGFGETFFDVPELAEREPDRRELPPGPWRYTDDTVMALGIHEVLDECGESDCDRLAEIFARRYRDEPWRGYGPGARRILETIDGGSD